MLTHPSEGKELTPPPHPLTRSLCVSLLVSTCSLLLPPPLSLPSTYLSALSASVSHALILSPLHVFGGLYLSSPPSPSLPLVAVHVLSITLLSAPIALLCSASTSSLPLRHLKERFDHLLESTEKVQQLKTVLKKLKSCKNFSRTFTH